MKVFDGDKLIKECDEGSYTRQQSGPTMSGGGWTAGAGGNMTFQPGFSTGSKEEYAVKYNLECEIPELKNGMTVELEGPEGMVSKYRVETPQ